MSGLCLGVKNWSPPMPQPQLFKTFRLPKIPSQVACRKTKLPPLTQRQIKAAQDHHRRVGGCLHEPAHETYTACVRYIAERQRGN